MARASSRLTAATAADATGELSSAPSGSAFPECEDFLLRTGDVFESLALACTLQLSGLRADCHKRIRGMTHLSERQFLRLPPDLLVRWLRADTLVVVRRGLPLTARARELYLLRCLPIFFMRLRREDVQDTWALPALLNLQLQQLPPDELQKTAESLLERPKQRVFSKARHDWGHGSVTSRQRAWTESRVRCSPPFGPGSDEAFQGCSEFTIEPRSLRQRMTEVRVWARTRNDTQMLSGLQVTYGKGEHSQTISVGDVTSCLVSQYRTQYDDEIISNVFVFKGEWIPSLELAWHKVGQLSRREGSGTLGCVVGASDSTFRRLLGFRGKVVTLQDGTTAICQLRFVFEEFTPRLPGGLEPLIIAVSDSSVVSLER